MSGEGGANASPLNFSESPKGQIGENMEYREFEKMVIEEVGPDLTEYRLVPIETEKNNRRVHGIRFEPVEGTEEMKVAPAIYLDDAYKAFEQGMDSKEIIELLKQYVHEALNLLPETILDVIEKGYEEFQNKILPVLYGTEGNDEFLKDKIKRYFLDMAVCYIVHLDEVGRETFHVTEKTLSKWGISEERLHEDAMKNLTDKGFGMKNVGDELREDLARRISNDTGMDIGICRCMASSMVPEIHMSVLSYDTENHIWEGAAVILNKEALEAVRKEFGDFYILPSSIREVLVLPVDKAGSCDLYETVRMANGSGVIRQEDILSNTVYFYNGEISPVEREEAAYV